ncbi:MAG: hypothetical protein P8J91_08900 [Pirellulaceae bacterium]|nr:hypothetical protein [Pirellulaceae bacterium]
MNNVEIKIREHVSDQMEIYACAIPLAEILANEFDASPEQQARLSNLEEVMNAAMVKNEELSGLMNQVGDVRQLSPQTRDGSSKLAERIAHMIKLFDQIEQRARRVKENLLPELNQSLQMRKMKSAYGNG